MVKPSKARRLEEFAHHDETYSVGDTVTLRPPNPDTPPFIARCVVHARAKSSRTFASDPLSPRAAGYKASRR